MDGRPRGSIKNNARQSQQVEIFNIVNKWKYLTLPCGTMNIHPLYIASYPVDKVIWLFSNAGKVFSKQKRQQSKMTTLDSINFYWKFSIQFSLQTIIVLLWSNFYFLNFVSQRIPWKIIKSFTAFKYFHSFWRFKFIKCVKYGNDRTDDVIHSTQYSV